MERMVRVRSLGGSCGISGSISGTAAFGIGSLDAFFATDISLDTACTLVSLLQRDCLRKA